jgi:hypothetical protein
MLMPSISIESQLTMKVNMHNQCLGLKLINHGCFSNGIDWNKEPDEKVDAGSIMSADSKSSLAVFEGALIYELQRGYTETDDQLESTYALLLVSWKSEGYKKFRVFLKLIECDRTFYWNNSKLERYYRKYRSQLGTYTDPIKDTWLIYNGTVLMTELELNFTQRDGVLNITISEGVKDEYTKRPEWINLNR